MHSIVAKAVFPADQSIICKYSFAISIVTLCTVLSLSLSFSCICDGAYCSSSSSSLIRLIILSAKIITSSIFKIFLLCISNEHLSLWKRLSFFILTHQKGASSICQLVVAMRLFTVFYSKKRIIFRFSLCALLTHY